ncbi:MAG: T9SS type A sorting domain-containing protein [Ignavibacteria bacterium]|nr:T9SS type A sorting domain-containing protein [Ignavibacteria bacterium]
MYQKIVALILITFVFINTEIYSQTAAAVWHLTADQSVIAAGDVTPSEQELSNMQVKYVSNVQRSSPTGTAGTWPSESSENVTRFMQFRISPTQGNLLNVTSLSLFLYASAGSGMRANVYYSKDSTFTDRTQIGSTFSLSSTAPVAPNATAGPNISIKDNETFYLRIYPWYTTSTTTKYLIAYSVVINGNTNSMVSVFTSVNTLEKFLQYPDSLSSTQFYFVSGTNLSENVVVTPPENFEISKDSGTIWNNSSSPITLTQTGGVIDGQPVSIAVRLHAANPGSYSGEITHSSGGALTRLVQVYGSHLPKEPTKQASITFGEATGHSIQVIFPGGDGEKRVLVIKADNPVNWFPNDGEQYSGVSNNFLSAEDKGSGNKIVYEGTDTSIAVIGLSSNMKYYFAVYEYNSADNGSQNYLITKPGTGSVPTVAVAALLTNPDLLAFGNLAANKDTLVKNYSLSGSLLTSGGGNISITAPEGFEISLARTSGFSSTILLPYLGDSLSSSIIYVRFIPTALKTYNETITNTGGGTSVNIPVFGVGVKEVIDANFPVGFASLNGGTTGGTGGDTVTAANAQQIADIMKLREKGINTPLIIYISGVLSGFSTEISVKRTSNISIIGLGNDAEFLGFGMKIVDCKNIIVRNILFADCKVDEKDGVSIDGSSNVWIDHCTFTDSPSSDPSGNSHDGELDIKSGAFNVTVSYNHFMNHRKTCLLGHTPDQVSDTTMKVTYYRNWFDGTYSRHPRIRFAKAHLLNNLYSNNGVNGGYGVGITCQAQVLVEGNYFENTPTPILISTVNDFGETLSGDPAGFVKTLDNYILHSGVLVENLTGYNFDPRIYYSYTPTDAQSIKDIVMQNAGAAKLDPVAINESQNSNSSLSFNLLQNYPNPFNPETVISWQLAVGGYVTLKIYDVLGNEVTRLVNEYQSEGIHHKIFSVEKNTFASGIYFYQLQAGSFMQMKKMVILK